MRDAQALCTLLLTVLELFNNPVKVVRCHKLSPRFGIHRIPTLASQLNVYFAHAARLTQLTDWVAHWCHESKVLSPVGSDAGFRKYFRFNHQGRSFVAVDAPPTTEDNHGFVTIADLWRKNGVHVPQVFAVDYEHGFMIQEDFGDVLLYTVLSSDNANLYYPELLDTLKPIQALPADTLPPYDETLIRFELSLYPQWFLIQFMKLESLPDLTAIFDLLVQTFAEQPQGTVHRDFHSRNLMLTNDSDIGVIDFQGALNGPLLYDPASLLRDCYLLWPPEQVNQWLLNFAAHHPVLKTYTFEQVQRWFDLTGLQRHLKCLGIFARLWLRDGKDGYLKELPRTLGYVLDVCQRYPELQAHGRWLGEQVQPVLQATINQQKGSSCAE